MIDSMKNIDNKELDEKKQGVAITTFLICKYCGKKFKKKGGLGMHIKKCQPIDGETKPAIEERRKEIISLLARGFSKSVIAKALGVHRKTVWNDIEAIKNDDRRRWNKLQLEEYLSDRFAQMNFLERMIKSDIFECKPDSLGRSAKQRDLIMLIEKEFKFLQETGKIPKIPDEFNINVERPDITKMNIKQLEELSRELRNQLADDVVKLADIKRKLKD